MGRVDKLHIVWDVRSLLSALKDLIPLDLKGLRDVLSDLQLHGG